MKFVTPSRTRWNGILDAILRYVRIEDIFQQWVSTTLAERRGLQLNRDHITESLTPLLALLPSATEMTRLKAIAYVLSANKIMDSLMQVGDAPTGVKCLRILQKLFATLTALRTTPAHRNDQ